MKKLSIISGMILMLASCMSEPLDVPGGRKGLQVSLEPDTKIQLNENRKPVWTKGDLLSVYDRTDANNQYMFDGNTGDRSGRILSTGFPEYGSPIDECIVVYPYSPDYVLDASGKTITATFPATQHYLKNSYGLGENILVSCGTGDTFTLRNVYGWLEFQFLGTKSIRKIELMDNKPSLLAGPITINYKSLETALVDSSSGDGDDVIATISRNNILTLDCGESGVQLDPLTPVSFFITLLPRTFDSGYSIKISYTDGSTPDVLKSTIKEVVERNTIKQYNPIKLNGVENPIVFADSAVKSICVANWDTNGDGELSYAEAAAVTDLGNVFTENTSIVSFDELRFFTGLSEICESAFDWCSNLINVTLPESITSIGYRAFCACNGLVSMVIPDATTTIGRDAFRGCDKLESITVGNGVVEIGDGAISLCTSLTNFYGKFASDDHKTLSNGNVLISVASDVTTYTIADGITEIGEWAFSSCRNLTEVNFSGSETELCGYSFGYCESLERIVIPNTVVHIRRGAFQSCTSLKEVIIGSGVETMEEGVFAGCSAITRFSGRYASEDGLRLEKDGVLLRVATGNMSSYEIPETITEIGEAAFNRAEDLTSVIIPNTVTSIGYDAFARCVNLLNIIIPDSVTFMSTEAFISCAELTTVTIGRGITSIANITFRNCPKLATIYCRAINPPSFSQADITASNGAFDGSTAISRIYVPTESVDLYKSAAGWSQFADMIEGYSFE